MIEVALQKVDAAIADDKYDVAVELLEHLSADGLLSGGDEVALTLLLMWPPLAAWDECLVHVRKALATDVRYEATCWGAYICQTLWPVTSEFHRKLKHFADRSEACYLVAKHEFSEGDRKSAQDWIQRTIEIDPFPNALLLAARHSWPDLEKKKRLLRQAITGVQDRCFEKASWQETFTGRDALRRNNWKELIRGELLTSHNWEEFYGKLLHENLDERQKEGTASSIQHDD